VIYTKVLIVGANSYVASQCLPGLKFHDSEVFLVSRETISSIDSSKINQANTLKLSNFEDSNVLNTLINFLQLKSDDNLLVINFTGSFGSIESLENLNLESFALEVNQNLIPFMVLSKLISTCDSGLFLSFAGAGIGGDNLEVASLSYLASKASIVLLVEGLDNVLRLNGIRVGAISPGAFPSRMQKLVAESENTSAVSMERKRQALITLESEVDPNKLISLLNFLIENPDMAGGRVWSANFDTLKTEFPDKNFGKLRRVY